MAIIPSFFMDAVIALGIDTGTNNKHWIASGFLVGRKETEDPNRFTIYIITNKHVVENKNLLYVRFNNSGNIGVKDLKLGTWRYLNKQEVEDLIKPNTKK